MFRSPPDFHALVSGGFVLLNLFGITNDMCYATSGLGFGFCPGFLGSFGWIGLAFFVSS
jgi:hypothetical protein